MEHLHGTYNLELVILSYIIASLASYAALDLAGRVSQASGMARNVWLTCGAVSMGLGIWSMHFVGMLAFVLPTQVSYSTGKVVLSVLLAIVASGVALNIAGRQSGRISKLMIAGVLMTAGISSMHYVGMAAMSIPVTYEPGRVVLSILIAALASFAALWLMFFSVIINQDIPGFTRWAAVSLWVLESLACIIPGCQPHISIIHMARW